MTFVRWLIRMAPFFLFDYCRIAKPWEFRSTQPARPPPIAPHKWFSFRLDFGQLPNRATPPISDKLGFAPGWGEQFQAQGDSLERPEAAGSNHARGSPLTPLPAKVHFPHLLPSTGPEGLAAISEFLPTSSKNQVFGAGSVSAQHPHIAGARTPPARRGDPYHKGRWVPRVPQKNSPALRKSKLGKRGM